MNYPDIECPVIGILRYEEKYDWYEGQLKVQQSEISIQLLTDDGAVASALKRATDFVKESEKHAQSARDYAVESLLLPFRRKNIDSTFILLLSEIFYLTAEAQRAQRA